jgi:hypothetical protein
MAARAAGIRTEVVPLTGGLDLTTPALQIPPGKLIDALNYEPALTGGYRRMYGYERFDGHPSPSAQDYWNMVVAVTGSIAVGATVTGATSGATAVVLQVNGTTELIVTYLTGTFVAETLNVSGTPEATVSKVSANAALTPLLHATYNSLAAAQYRLAISKVPGSGPVLGCWYYNGALYAFRNNVGGTAAVMYQSTSNGWVAVTLGLQMQFAQRSGVVTMTSASPCVITLTKHGAANGTPVSFATTGALYTGLTAGTTYYVVNATTNTFEVALTVGGTPINTSGSESGVQTATFQGFGQVNVGDTITGATSGSTAVVAAALLMTGTWGVEPVGSFVFASQTGTFVTGEALTDGGQLVGQATTGAVQIVLQPGGRYEFCTANFTGALTTAKMYGADGANYAFEFDGTTYVPIITGLHTDTPNYICAWQNMLILAYGSNVEVSGIGLPYSWTALTGAAVIALGDTCSGLLPQLGDQTGGALAMFTSGIVGLSGKTYILYGTSVADFNLVIQSPDAGAVPHTAQNIGFAYYLDTKGIAQINSTRNYGNFEISTLTRSVQPLIDAKRGMTTASCVVRSTNQYRLFFNDGTGLILFMQSSISQYTNTPVTSVGGIMPFNMQSAGSMYVNTVASAVDSTGVERIFASGSDGYVYELERGTSQDGANIQSHLFTAFNSSKSPRNRKHYHRTVLQATCLGTAELTVGYTLSYGSGDAADGAQTTQDLIGGGSWWDVFNWDQFNWDAPFLTDYEIDTPGDGVNLGLIIYGDTAIDLPYTISSGILHYTINRLER